MEQWRLDKLRGLEAFRDYEERVEAEARVKAEMKVKAAIAKAKLETKGDDLIQCFVERGDNPVAHVFREVAACTDVRQMGSWLTRAFMGETSAEIFPEPQRGAVSVRRSRPMSKEEVLAAFANAPVIDPLELGTDLDEFIDPEARDPYERADIHGNAELPPFASRWTSKAEYDYGGMTQCGSWHLPG